MKHAVPTTRGGVRKAVLLGLAMLPIAGAPPALAGHCSISTSLIIGTTSLCQRCTYQVYFSTSKDTPCFNTPEQGGRPVIETVLVGSAIAKQPRHGRLQLEGATWTYTPNKGFVGEDVFTMERDYIQNTKTVHVIYVESHMTVGP